MSDFYTSLAEHYDEVFPPEPDIVSFLERSMQGRTNLLDIACGTGTYALELASRGFNVTGIDVEERMVELAKEKLPSAVGEAAADEAPEVEFYRADMTGSGDGASVFSRTYGGAYCIGNSLPHLGNTEEVEKALTVWQDALEPGGVIVVQIVNFERFRSEKYTELPSIERDGLVFTRRYVSAPDAPGDAVRARGTRDGRPVKGATGPNGEAAPGTPGSAAGSGESRNAAAPRAVDFEATLSLPRTRRVLKNSVRLLVIHSEYLDRSLRKAGFRDLEFFGSYDGEVYNEKTSFLLICRARRG